MIEDKDKKYIYPVETLDTLIKQMQQGIDVMLDDQLEMEVKLRLRELEQELIDDDELDEDDEMSALSARHKEIMLQKMEEEKRKASKIKDIIIPITPEQEKELREGVSVSIVRNNPDSIYHADEKQLNMSKEKKILMDKLSRIKPLYYNATDFINAINIIKEAILYSLHHDYPMLSFPQALKQFNEGHIKFTGCKIPKLMLDYKNPVSDPQMLAGIVSGEIKVKDFNDDEKAALKRKEKRKQKSNPVEAKYTILSGVEEAEMLEYAKRGYLNPMSVVMETQENRFNRYAFPSERIFAQFHKQKPIDQEKERMIETFDWTQPDALARYMDLIEDRHTDVDSLVDMFNKDNKINPSFKSEMLRFLNAMNRTSDRTVQVVGQNNNGFISSALEVDQEALHAENVILAAMHANNPLK